MQQISNKSLIFLLILVIVVSIGGTIISINRLSQLISQAPSITAMASSSGTGMVNVSVAAVTSITATDAIINFGSCSPATTYGCNVSSDAITAQCSCDGGIWPDNITIKNDGNRDLNVTVTAGSTARAFIGGTAGGEGQAEMWFRVTNATDLPGCYNQTGMANPPSGAAGDAVFNGTTGMQHQWKNFTTTTDNLPACINLTYGISTNSFYLFAKLFLPANAPAAGNQSSTLTFTASAW